MSHKDAWLFGNSVGKNVVGIVSKRIRIDEFDSFDSFADAFLNEFYQELELEVRMSNRNDDSWIRDLYEAATHHLSAFTHNAYESYLTGGTNE
jgi:hypothetical protein